MSIKDSRHLKNQRKNNNGDNNSNNANLARALVFQVDTGKNVENHLENSRKSSSRKRKTFFKGVFYCYLFDCSSASLFICLFLLFFR